MVVVGHGCVSWVVVAIGQGGDTVTWVGIVDDGGGLKKSVTERLSAEFPLTEFADILSRKEVARLVCRA